MNSQENQPLYDLLREDLDKGRVIPFLGAGASRGERPADYRWKDKEPRGFLPNAWELAEYLAERSKFPQGQSTLDLAKVAQWYGFRVDRPHLQQDLHEIFASNYRPAELHQYLARLTEKLLIVTTNYDDLIERAFDAEGKKYAVVIHTTETEDMNREERVLVRASGAEDPLPVKTDDLGSMVDLKETTVIYKMHGAVDRHDPVRDQYVIAVAY